jgi:glycosyltransferase 2 family protein
MLPQNILKYGKSILKALFTVLLFIVIAYFLDWDMVFDTLKKINFFYFIIAVIIIVPEHGLLAYRWYIIISKNVNVSFTWHLKKFLISVFLSTYTPSPVVGDIYRFAALKDKSEDRWLLFGSLIKERVIGVVGYSIFYLICYSLYQLSKDSITFNYTNAYDIAAVILVIGIFSMIPFIYFIRVISKWNYFIRYKKIQDILRTLIFVLEIPSASWAAIMLFISIVVCIFWTASIYIIGIELEILSLSPWPFFLISGMVGVLSELIRAIPITIQGIGIREGIFAFLLTINNASFDQAFVLGAVAYLALSISIIIAGLIGFSITTSEESE